MSQADISKALAHLEQAESDIRSPHPEADALIAIGYVLIALADSAKRGAEDV